MNKEIEEKLLAFLNEVSVQEPKKNTSKKQKKFNLIQVLKLKEHLKDE